MPNMGDASLAVYSILGANLAVFLAWQYAINSYDHDLHASMQRNFVLTRENLRSGRLWTLITSNFSHMGLMHFAINMLVVGSFGRSVASDIGGKRFFALYMLGGLASSLATSFYHAVIVPRVAGACQPVSGA